VDAYGGWDGIFTAGHAAAEYLALTRPQAEEQAAARGVVNVRVADLDADPKVVLTFDLKLDRLTLLVHNGHVVRSGFF
jgi:hypothetical protein